MAKRWPREILIFGQDPAIDWAIAALNAAFAVSLADGSNEASPPILTRVGEAQFEVVEAPTEEDKACAILLPLEDPPGTIDSIESFWEGLKLEGQRLVLAIELQRRFARTVVLPYPPIDEPAAIRSLLSSLCEAPDRGSPAADAAGAALDAAAPPASPVNTAERAEVTSNADQPVHPDDGTACLTSRLQFARAGYAARLREWLTTRKPLKITLAREVFHNAGKVGPPPVVDLAGIIRHVYYGPYFALPTGRWTMTAYVGFGGPVSRLLCFIEINTDTVVARGYFNVEGPGIYKVSLPVRLEKPGLPVEVRIANQEVILEGTIALLEVEFVPEEQN